MKYTPSTDAYIVGGFVRDRLLGTKSNDIDIMLSNVNGADFAKLIAKDLNIKEPHVIKENPEKSKFITTAKIYVPLSVLHKITDEELIRKTKEIQYIAAEAIHFDVRDNNYFSNTGRENANTKYPDNTIQFNAGLINRMKDKGINISFDVHLLYWSPSQAYIKEFADTGLVKSIDIQFDAFNSKSELLEIANYIKSLGIRLHNIISFNITIF